MNPAVRLRNIIKDTHTHSGADVRAQPCPRKDPREDRTTLNCKRQINAQLALLKATPPKTRHVEHVEIVCLHWAVLFTFPAFR